VYNIFDSANVIITALKVFIAKFAALLNITSKRLV